MEDPTESIGEVESLVVPLIERKCWTSTGVKTLRLGINLFTNALIFVTVFVCLAFASRPPLTVFSQYVIYSTIGFQFILTQAVMALSPYNCWTVLLKRQHRVHVHWVLHLVSVALTAAGIAFYILDLRVFFATWHDSFGLVATGVSIFSFIDGIVAFIVTKYCKNEKVKIGFNWFHLVTALITIILATVSLGFAYENVVFRSWLNGVFNNDEIPVILMQFINGLFALLIVLNVTIPDQEDIKYIC